MKRMPQRLSLEFVVMAINKSNVKVLSCEELGGATMNELVRLLQYSKVVSTWLPYDPDSAI